MAIGRNDNYVQQTFTADTFRKRRKRENSMVGPGLCPDTENNIQHNWKKGSSSPREASVIVSPSKILSVSKGQESRVKEC